MALEEGGEVPEVSRRIYLWGASGVGASNPSAGIEAFMGRAPGGYCRCNGYRGIPVHLLLGSVIGPSSAQGRINDPSYGEDPREEAPREENDDGNY
jgi:hypothetical protein